MRTRPSSKMTKYVECWGADKPFANITDSKKAKNIGLAVKIKSYTILVALVKLLLNFFYRVSQ